MRVVIHTREHGPLEFDAVGGMVELKLREGDPEFPSRHYLDDVERIEVSEHPPPIVQGPAEQPRYKEVEIDNSVYGFVEGKRVRVGKPRTFTTLALDTKKPKAPKRKPPKVHVPPEEAS